MSCPVYEYGPYKGIGSFLSLSFSAVVFSVEPRPRLTEARSFFMPSGELRSSSAPPTEYLVNRRPRGTGCLLQRRELRYLKGSRFLARLGQCRSAGNQRRNWAKAGWQNWDG